MADRRIDQLTQSESVNDDDLFVIWKRDISQTRSLKMESIMPVGALIPFYSNIAPEGWLMCDGTDTTGTSNELRLYHPKLYEILGNSNVLPDLRECVLVGAGQSTRAILDTTGHAHDVYTLGEFKDDQIQSHTHSVNHQRGSENYGAISGGYLTVKFDAGPSSANTGRTGTTTHGKQLGVNYIIKC